MRFLRDIQIHLEEWYGASTGLDVGDFVVAAPNFGRLGELLVQDEAGDLEIALLLDRDILAAWDPHGEKSTAPEPTRALTVPFEEVSHFVYLGFNHRRGRNVTALEMEIQSEIDRVLLAYHGPFGLRDEQSAAILNELNERRYESARHEESRVAAAAFLRRLSGGDPRAWNERERESLRAFFHSDLSEKLRFARGGRP